MRAGRMMLMRTAKSCRSDAPMLASSLREGAQATVSNKPGHRGEREVSRKTIARGMPGDFRCDRGDYARMLILFCMRGCGRVGRPAFPAPSVFLGRLVFAKLGRLAPRECGVVSQSVIPAQRLRRCRWRREPCGALAPLGEPRRMSGPEAVVLRDASLRDAPQDDGDGLSTPLRSKSLLK